MRSRKGRGIAVVLAATAVVAALSSATAIGAGAASTFSFLVHNQGTEYVTAAGPTSAYPGRLQIGDRILTRDSLQQGTRSIGYDNELCTVTFDYHDLCQATLALPGKGQIQASWLWIHWPSSFTGVIDGGTGTFSHAKGQFKATILDSSTLRVTATLR